MSISIVQKIFALNKPLLAKSLQKKSYSDINKLNAPHKVDSWERRFLVWTGKYKSIEEVPNFVGQGVMEQARNRMRIRVANLMMAATVLGCVLMIYLGKEDRKRGESISKRTEDWHKKLKEEYANEQVTAKAE